MIEKIVIDFLSGKLDVPVFAEVPDSALERFVVVEKTGSGIENHICSAVIAIQSHAQTLLCAAELNELVKNAMCGLDELDAICRVERNSDYNFTNTASKSYRYQAVYDITHY